jgi:hypothetical protein
LLEAPIVLLKVLKIRVIDHPQFFATANLKTESYQFLIEESFMVYCSKCGTQNPDTNTVCSNCGAPLYTVGQRYPGSDREHYRRMENECFGLPNGGMIVGIVIGVIIILVGLSLFLQATYGIWIDLWPFIIIIFGVLILVGALFRQRRYSQRPTNPP